MWITPIVFLVSIRQGEKGKISVPTFIVFFLLASVLSSVLPFPSFFKALASAGKVFMAAALYMVGFGLHRTVVRQAGARGILFGMILWAVSIVTGYILASVS